MIHSSSGMGRADQKVSFQTCQLYFRMLRSMPRHTKHDGLRVHTYHGQKRISVFSELSKFDIIITTYATLEAEWSTRSRSRSKNGDIIHSGNWFRIVLDEGMW